MFLLLLIAVGNMRNTSYKQCEHKLQKRTANNSEFTPFKHSEHRLFGLKIKDYFQLPNDILTYLS